MTLEISKLKAQIQTTAQQAGEPEWLIDRRLRAMELFAELPMPTMQEFSYNGWPLLPDDNHLGLKFAAPSQAAIEAANSPSQSDVIVHSLAQGQTVIDQETPAGVTVEDLAHALTDYPATVQANLMSTIPVDQDRITAYHQAMMNSGTLVEVAKNTQLEEPIEIRTVQDATVTNQPLVDHLLIVAHPGSVIHIVQHLTAVGNVANSANLMVEIVAEANSEVHFAVLDETGANITTYLNRRANIANDAHVEWAVGMMNDGNVLGDVDAELIGEGSKADSKLIAVTSGHQHIGLNNRVTNRGPHSTGLINQRGVVLDASELIFNGIGQIIHGAHGSEAEQQNRLLMMSPQARGDANPILLIDENDVNAGHAASVGQVDAQQLYYLLSRGIPEHQAKRMVIRGFLSAVLTALPNRQLENEMVAILERKLLNE